MTGADPLAWLRPSQALPSGRYALDRHGRLHPEWYARIVRAVAIVRVRCKAEAVAPMRCAKSSHETPAAGIHTAVEARPVLPPVRCDGPAPEGASGAAAGKTKAPANAGQTRPSFSAAKTKAKKKKPRRSVERLLAVEAKRPVDYSRTVAAMRARANSHTARKPAPAVRTESRCEFCGEPGPRVCEYCKAVGNAA